MKALLSATLIHKLPAANLDVWDTRQPKLVLRMRASGTHSYLVTLGRGKWFTLGQESALKTAEAREMAHNKLSEQLHGDDPIATRKQTRGQTFDAFMSDRYRPWALATIKGGVDHCDRITFHFSPLFGDKPLAEITGWAIEKWRSKRLQGDHAVKPATVNKDIAVLKAALAKAVEWKLLRDHPLKAVKLAKLDRSANIRYLTPAEEARLRTALQARDDRRRAERDHANAWRREREYPTLPDFATYTDHLQPIVLLALNTGCRRGELFGLKWRDVDMVAAVLTVRGEGAKSGKTRHVPMNAEAQAVLKAWRPEKPKADALVFPGDEGAELNTIKSAWLSIAKAATLTKFRFHDLRHTFASKLVQAGVDLNTVRELLGHSDFALTLRYAHLAATNLAEAVAKLAAR